MLKAFLALALSAVLTAQAADSQNLWDIYQLALANDPSLAAARSGNLASQEKLVQGHALFKPSVSLNGSANYSNSDAKYSGAAIFPEVGWQSFNTYTYSLNLNQPLYRKQNNAQLAQAQMQVTQADKSLQLAQQDLMLRSAQAYFDVLLAQDKIELIHAQKTAISRQLEQAQANFDAGNATITDVDEAKARFDLISANEIAAQNDLALKNYAIQALTGQAPQPLASTLSEIKPILPEVDLPAWEQVAQQNNLTLSIQQQQLAIATQEVEKQNAGHLPTLDAVASYSDNRADGSIYGFGSDVRAASVGVQLQIPIYQGGAISSRVREALANKQKAQDELEASLRKVVLEARQSYLNLASSAAQLAAYQQALASSQSQLDSTNLGYEVGVRTSVDVLNAQQQYYSAKRDLLQARYSYLINTLKLKASASVLAESDMQSLNQQLVRR